MPEPARTAREIHQHRSTISDSPSRRDKPDKPIQWPTQTSPALCKSSPISPSRQSTNRTHSTLSIPFPTARLANIALTSISVDAELSPLVRRTFALEAPSADHAGKDGKGEESVLRVEYKATTNRMLRVATNAFMESLKLVVEVMERMDVVVLGENLQKEVEAAA